MKYFGIPVWAWISGLSMGAVVGFLLFDDVIVSLMFAVSIGTAFAIAFHESETKKAKADDASQRVEG